MSSAPSARTTFRYFFVGIFLAQLAWVIALPAYAGIDEFDHVYKAASVARGEVSPVGVASVGRGDLVVVPRDIVLGATPVCTSYKYTGFDNCHPVEDLGHGMVTVASAASRYNPVYYAIVGTVARPFHGGTAVYVMRISTALMCALLIAWSAAVVASWSRGRWPLVALVVAVTPVFLYSTAVASPNGIGYAAGLLVWAAVVGLSRRELHDPPRLLLSALAVGGAALTITHTTGPMWLALICGFGFWLQKPARWCQLLVRYPRETGATIGVLAVTTVASLLWTSTSGANTLATDVHSTAVLTTPQLLNAQAAWILQSVAAFPLRNERAPLVVYAFWLTAMTWIMIIGLRHARRRDGLVVAGIVVMSFVVPTVLTVMSYNFLGLAWQGRYELPLVVGLFLIAASRRDVSSLGRNRLMQATLVLTTTATVVSVVAVAHKEIQTGVTRSIAAAVPGGLLLVAGLAVAGALIPLLALWTRKAPPDLVEIAPARVPIDAEADR